jgi:hypothetical protein
MSQIINLASGGGGGGGVLSVTTDSGMATPSGAGVLNIIAGLSTLNSGSTVEFTGSGNTVELHVTDAGDNTIVGLLAGKAGMTGVRNSGLGWESFNALTTGNDNTAIGARALIVLATGSQNTCVGSASGLAMVAGNNNTSIGQTSLHNITSGSSNTAVGKNALAGVTTGSTNIALGYLAGQDYTDVDSDNISIGNQGVGGNSGEIRIGTLATHTTCYIQGISGISVSNLNLVTIDTSANQLGSMSAGSLASTFDGDSGTATPSGGVLNIIAGVSSQNCGSTVEFTGSANTVTLNVTDANNNTIIGKLAGNTVTGVDNTGIGYESLQGLSTGSYNTALGFQSLNAISIGQVNVAIGYRAMAQATSGQNNVAIGRLSAQYMNGQNNTVVGDLALFDTTNGDNNIVIGASAGSNYNNSNESNNILLANAGVLAESGAIRIGTNGTQTSCYIQGIEGVSVSNLNYVTIDTTTGQLGSTTSSGIVTLDGNSGSASGSTVSIVTTNEQTLVLSGSGSTLTLNTTDANNNVAYGANAMTGNGVTGTFNTGVGEAALNLVSTGFRNAALGAQSLSNITTGSYNVGIGFDGGNSLGTTAVSNICINSLGSALDTNTLRMGQATGSGTRELNKAFICGIYGITTTSATTSTVLVSNGDQLGTVSSSARFKNSIQDMSDQSSAIMKLRPVTFLYNAHTDNVKQYGLIAEEVNEIMPGIVNLDDEGKPFAVRYHDLVPMLLNELQKLSAVVKTLAGQAQNKEESK